MADPKAKAYLTWPTEDGSSVCWPNPLDPLEAEWSLRYSPESSTGIASPLTREQQLYAASVISAYCALISLDSRTRQQRVMELRATLNG